MSKVQNLFLYDKSNLLLNPGPVNTNSDVKFALNTPDMCHREPEFYCLLESVSNKLTILSGSDENLWTSVILTGSGTSALESVLGSVVPFEGCVLILNNGNYGNRIQQIVKTLGIPHVHLDFGWANTYCIEDIEKALSENPQITHVAMIHHETSTSMLNPLRIVGDLCRAHSVELIVDAISSFGGDPMDVIEDNITWCIGSSNKCLEGLPGLSFIVAPKEEYEKLEYIKPRSYYLDLHSHYVSQTKKMNPLFTPAVQIFSAFDKALDNLMDESLDGRYNRYNNLANFLRDGLEKLGLKFFIPRDEMSNTLTVIYLPESTSYEKLHSYMKEKGIIIYHGSNDPNPVFRISSMGQITHKAMFRFLELLNGYIKEK